MTNTTITIFDALTQETIEREMTDAEIAQFETDKINRATQLKAEAKAATDKAALLAKLGITADEAKLLLS